MKMEIPDKLYFKIGEVAKFADVPPHVLRYWESEFPEIKPKRTGNSQQRLYRREDVLTLLSIKSLLHEQGFTIAGAKKILEQNAPASIPTRTQPQISSKQDIPSSLRNIKIKLQEIKFLIESRSK